MVTILHTFVGTDGANPCSGLFQPISGDSHSGTVYEGTVYSYFYGTTCDGGTTGNGTIFIIDSSGDFYSQYSFQGGTDGARPVGDIFQTTDGNLFGTTERGGADSDGTLYELAFKTNTHSVLYSFNAALTSSEYWPVSNIILGVDGNLYSTALGGLDGAGDIFKAVLPLYVGSVAITPTPTTLTWGQRVVFTAKAYDQHGTLLSSQPSLLWSDSNPGGSVSISGNTATLTANSTSGGNFGLGAFNYITTNSGVSFAQYMECFGDVTYTILNPVPTITSISPTSANLDAGNTTLTVNGTGFAVTASVQWNGVALATTYVSATKVTAVIPAADLTVAGSFNVTVSDPAPGGGTSAAKIFTVL